MCVIWRVDGYDWSWRCSAGCRFHHPLTSTVNNSAWCCPWTPICDPRLRLLEASVSNHRRFIPTSSHEMKHCTWNLLPKTLLSSVTRTLPSPYLAPSLRGEGPHIEIDLPEIMQGVGTHSGQDFHWSVSFFGSNRVNPIELKSPYGRIITAHGTLMFTENEDS
jgi:hypothetical protein